MKHGPRRHPHKQVLGRTKPDRETDKTNVTYMVVPDQGASTLRIRVKLMLEDPKDGELCLGRVKPGEISGGSP